MTEGLKRFEYIEADFLTLDQLEKTPLHFAGFYLGYLIGLGASEIGDFELYLKSDNLERF